jgi:hypothetical protein
MPLPPTVRRAVRLAPLLSLLLLSGCLVLTCRV